MATSAEILARLRQEQEWQRSGWQQAPAPTPTPPMGAPPVTRNPYPVGSMNNPAPAPKQTQTQYRNPYPTGSMNNPAPSLQAAGQQYQRNQYDPLSSARTPKPTSTPATAPAMVPAAQSQYRNPYPVGSMNNPTPAPAAPRPMYGPPTKEQAAAQGSTMGRMIDRGQGFPTAPAQPAPLYNAKEVLLDYLLQTNDPDMLDRLARQAANPIQQDILYDEGTDREGLVRMRRGGPDIEEVLNAYASVQQSGEPIESIWNRKPAPENPNRSRRNAILEGGGTGDPVLDYLLRTGDPATIARLQGNAWGRSILARYEQLNQG